MELLRRHHGAPAGLKVAVLGLAFKEDTDDVRESPALDILRLLESRGARVAYHDPHVAQLRMEEGALLRSEELLPAAREADLVLIVTDHRRGPYRELVDAARVVLDTRNATKGIVSDKIVKL